MGMILVLHQQCFTTYLTKYDMKYHHSIDTKQKKKNNNHICSPTQEKTPHIKNCIACPVSGLRLISCVKIQFFNVIMILQMKMEQDFYSFLFSGPVLAYGQDREHAVQQH